VDVSRTDRWTALFWILGAANVANGVWMLADPAGWYHGLPAAVPDTGPLNAHFVRDVGGTYLVMGVALLWAGARPSDRTALVSMVLLFHLIHAGAHALDTIEGRLPSTHWAIDFPGVYLPALVLAAMLYVSRAAGVATRRS
jgi:hypothetical protein